MRYIEMFAGIGGFRRGFDEANGEFWKAKNQEIAATRHQAISIREASAGCGLRHNGDSSDHSAGNACLGLPPAEDKCFRAVWANDFDKYACAIYRRHYGDKELFEGDIRTVDPASIPDADLLAGGFPCQTFSIAGKRRGFEDTRGTLFFEICRILRVKRIKYLLLENVQGLLSHAQGNTFEVILESLDELGYDCQWCVLNSAGFGVPQHRDRVFIAGYIREGPRPQIFPFKESYREDNELFAEGPQTGAITARRGEARSDGAYIIESARPISIESAGQALLSPQDASSGEIREPKLKKGSLRQIGNIDTKAIIP